MYLALGPFAVRVVIQFSRIVLSPATSRTARLKVRGELFILNRCIEAVNSFFVPCSQFKNRFARRRKYTVVTILSTLFFYLSPSSRTRNYCVLGGAPSYRLQRFVSSAFLFFFDDRRAAVWLPRSRRRQSTGSACRCQQEKTKKEEE